MDVYYPRADAPREVYQAPEPEIAPVMGLGDWVISLVISLIPVVNVIVLVIWAFSGKINPNRRNFAIAMLLLIGAYCVMVAMYFGYFAGLFYHFSEILQ